jgi:hypothetical protein
MPIAHREPRLSKSLFVRSFMFVRSFVRYCRNKPTSCIYYAIFVCIDYVHVDRDSGAHYTCADGFLGISPSMHANAQVGLFLHMGTLANPKQGG